MKNQASGVRGQKSGREQPVVPALPPDFEVERYELYEAPRYRFELDRREFVKALGGGIVVCLVLGEAVGQPPRQQRPGGARPQDLGAWLHIDEKGLVTVYTGKVEVGQNIRTSL